LLDAEKCRVRAVDAAHRPCTVTWWWDAKTDTAIIESASVVGMAMLQPNKFHPGDLDTFGLGNVVLAASRHGARRIIIGLGGSATNDAGFGFARAVGWQSQDAPR
jgi:glycerate kinase